MQQKLHPVLLLTTVAVAMAVCLRASWAQQATAVTGYDPAMQYDQAMQYGPAVPRPYGQDGYGLVPGPPSQPVPASRPESWPGTQAPPKQWGPPRSPPPNGGWGTQPRHVARVPGYAGVPAAQPPPAANMELLEGPKIFARVGPEVILASEVTPGINEVIERNKDRIPADELQRQCDLLIQQKLKQQIETKLIYLDAKQTIPEENFPKIEKNIGEKFEQVELQNLIKRAKVETRQELDETLRRLGTSLEREKRAFVQRALAQSWIHEQVKFDGEITYDEMLEYYRDHVTEFENPARGRWKELMVRFSKHPTKAEAGAAIAAMGNQVAAGAPFEQVAKAESEGTTASDGGVRDWVTKDSLVSGALNRALFELPVGQLSPILECENGFYIIVVTEREEARRTPFLEAQVEIEPKIKEQRAREQMRAYVLRLKERTPVWTIFDDADEAANARRPPQGPYPRR